MADLNLPISPSSGGKKPKAPALKVPTTGTPKLCINPAGDHSLVSHVIGAIVGVVPVAVFALAIFLSNPSVPVTQGTGTGTRTTASSVTPTGHMTRVSAGVEGIVFAPNHIEVSIGDRLVTDFTNLGGQHHNLVFETGMSSGSLASGKTKELDLGIVSGDVKGWCSLPGHRELGMTLHMQAAGASSSSSSSPGTSASGSHVYHGHDHGQDAAAGPATPTALIDYTEAVDARDPVLPPVTNGTERHYIFTITKQIVNVTSSLTRESWTFNGDTPGPTLHGHIDDTFYITLVNDGMVNHSLDLHAGLVAPDNVMRSIESGQTLEYIFITKNTGIRLYHCSTVPVSMHIASGIFGVVIIDPIDLDKVNREYIMVISEFYLGVNGRPADASLLSVLQPNTVAFSGVPSQYKAYPIQAKTNEHVCVRVTDAGPNLTTTFHVVGTQFNAVWHEGVYVIWGGRSGGGWRQVLILGTAGDGLVEFTPLEAGHYIFVNHVLSLAEKGQVGVFRVTGQTFPRSPATASSFVTRP